MFRWYFLITRFSAKWQLINIFKWKWVKLGPGIVREKTLGCVIRANFVPVNYKVNSLGKLAQMTSLPRTVLSLRSRGARAVLEVKVVSNYFLWAPWSFESSPMYKCDLPKVFSLKSIFSTMERRIPSPKHKNFLRGKRFHLKSPSTYYFCGQIKLNIGKIPSFLHMGFDSLF